MTPIPDLWRPFTSTEQPDGLRVLTLDGIPWWVRNLRRDADGVVRGECQAQSDGWVEKFFAAREAKRR